MTAKVLSFLSGKGGVGKSTLCAAMALRLADQNLKVLLIDGDLGWKNLDLILDLSREIVYDLGSVLSCQVSWQKAIVPLNGRKDCFFLAGTLSQPQYPGLENTFESMIAEAKDKFDMILIDLGSGFLPWHEFVITLCSDIYLISTVHPSSLRNADQILGLLGKTHRLHWLINQSDDRKHAFEIAQKVINYPLEGIIPLMNSIEKFSFWNLIHPQPKSLLESIVKEIGRQSLDRRWLQEKSTVS